MYFKSVDEVTSEAQAQATAIQWQEWQSTQALSYEDLSVYQSYFEKLADKFNLTDEFKENGII